MLVDYEFSLTDETFSHILQAARPRSGRRKAERPLSEEQEVELKYRLQALAQTLFLAVLQRNQPTSAQVRRKLGLFLRKVSEFEELIRGFSAARPSGLVPSVTTLAAAELRRGMHWASSRSPGSQRAEIDLDNFRNDLALSKTAAKFAINSASRREAKQRERAAKAGTARPSERARRSAITTGDPAAQALISDLHWAWRLAFGEMPGASVGAPGTPIEGKVGGPFVRFVQTCLAWLKDTMPAELIERDPLLKKCLQMSPAAIRQRLKEAQRSRLKAVPVNERRPRQKVPNSYRLTAGHYRTRPSRPTLPTELRKCQAEQRGWSPMAKRG